MKKIWLLLFVLVLWQCSSLSLATSSHHKTYRVKSLSHADIKFQLNRLYYRPITPSFIYWMPAYEGALNSWETIARQQQRWDMIYGAGSPDWSWHWFSPYYTNTWYNPFTFGWFPQPNYYINPYTGDLLPREETHVTSPRPRYTPPRVQPRRPKPRPKPRPRLPKDIYMSSPQNNTPFFSNTQGVGQRGRRELPRPTPTYSAPSRTAGETISRNVVRGSSPKGGRRQQ